MRRIVPRRIGIWIAFGVLAAVGRPAANTEGPRAAVERFAGFLEAGDANGLVDLYHRAGAHRDLATGEMVHGGDALRALYSARLAPADREAGRVRIDSFRLLNGEVAVAQLTLFGPSGAAGGGARPWPPYTVLVVSREGGRWGVVATRAGGNPDARESELRLEP